MNNSQFRKLVLDVPAQQPGASGSVNNPGIAPKRDGAIPSVLGSRMRSSIPMTPRSVATAGGVDFRRQLAERASASQPAGGFRSTAVPRGVKLPSGYVDRASERESEHEDKKEARVKALEEMMKLQQIDQPTFEKLRDEIVGGDVGSVHLVKGLDYKLLERVRKGEDVFKRETNRVDGKGGQTTDMDVEKELEMLQDREIAPVAKEKTVKKGEMAQQSLVPGKKRNRDQILAEMKASRIAQKEKTLSSLGARFKKVGSTATNSRIERDSKGREVLITVDGDGKEKRKVRKVQSDQPEEKHHGLLMPDKDAKPLGMEVPEMPKVAREEEDIDIFEEAGDDYDPLASFEEDDDSESEDSIDSPENSGQGVPKPTPSKKPQPDISPTLPVPARPRNYFGDSKGTTADSSQSTSAKSITDPTILAALKKASTLRPLAPDASNTEEATREARHRKMLEADDRDAQDLDMGFGSSRLEDEEDLEEKKIRLSEWGDGDAAWDGRGGGKGKRKRGPKRRKGDGENAADVLSVLERRKAEKG